jgi:glutathione reductase (NADPH)
VRLSRRDWSVAIVDHQPYGTWALPRCDPKKMLIVATEVVDGFEP